MNSGTIKKNLIERGCVQEMDDKTLKKLDQINLLWLLKGISLGNLVKGVMFLTGLLKPVSKCIPSTLDKVKVAVKKEKTKKEQKPETEEEEEDINEFET